jgi:hypothetical protein
VHAEQAESVAAVRKTYNDIRTQLDTRKEQAEALQEAIRDDLGAGMPKIGKVPLPQPAVADEPEALFDSRRSYAEQLRAYSDIRTATVTMTSSHVFGCMLIEACRGQWNRFAIS